MKQLFASIFFMICMGTAQAVFVCQSGVHYPEECDDESPPTNCKDPDGWGSMQQTFAADLWYGFQECVFESPAQSGNWWYAIEIGQGQPACETGGDCNTDQALCPIQYAQLSNFEPMTLVNAKTIEIFPGIYTGRGWQTDMPPVHAALTTAVCLYEYDPTTQMLAPNWWLAPLWEVEYIGPEDEPIYCKDAANSYHPAPSVITHYSTNSGLTTRGIRAQDQEGNCIDQFLKPNFTVGTCGWGLPRPGQKNGKHFCWNFENTLPE